MPRLPRINLEGAIYYVTAKGAQNQELFKDKADYQMYLELLAKYKKEHQFKLFSYCLLPEHLELLIETSDDLPAGQTGATISEIMHDLNSLYTKYFNGRHGQRGHLFDARFKSVLVEKANYLLKMTRHIHLARSVDPKEYPYSSFHIYLLNDRPAGDPAGATPPRRVELSEEVKEVMRFLTDKDDPQIYERYCLEGNPSEIEELKKKLRRSQMLGSESFQNEVKNRIKEYSEEQREAANLKVPSKSNRVLLVMVGAVILIAMPATAFLYISKRSIENKYDVLLKEKETQFTEKTRFENRSPLALTELDGTEWELELVPSNQANAETVMKDKIVFSDGRFSSTYFEAKGFRSASYFLVPKGQGIVAWQTAQSDPTGGNVRWNGEWRGDAMKGVATFQTENGVTQSFAFFSKKWDYHSASVMTAGSAP